MSVSRQDQRWTGPGGVATFLLASDVIAAASGRGDPLRDVGNRRPTTGTWTTDAPVQGTWTTDAPLQAASAAGVTAGREDRRARNRRYTPRNLPRRSSRPRKQLLTTRPIFTTQLHDPRNSPRSHDDLHDRREIGSNHHNDPHDRHRGTDLSRSAVCGVPATGAAWLRPGDRPRLDQKVVVLAPLPLRVEPAQPVGSRQAANGSDPAVVKVQNHDTHDPVREGCDHRW